MKRVLITGGFGYIGGSISLALSQRGYEVHLYDDGSRSEVSLARCHALGTTQFTKASILDQYSLVETFRNFNPDALIHCAGLKSVAESEIKKDEYWQVNVKGTKQVCEVWANRGRLIFSSSASIYRTYSDSISPISELRAFEPLSVYGKTKAAAENFLGRNSVALRYFNPAGTYEGIVSTNKRSENLFDVLRNKDGLMSIYGGDYPTPDGTCVRDYIHIEDLVEAHIWALEKVKHDHWAYNVGTGTGTSVKEILTAMEREYEISNRRTGDVDSLIADPSRAREAGFTCKKTIEDIIASELESKKI